MAESAIFHVERMIPELEQIRRLNLFHSEELTEIIKKRKEFEHKIERSKKEKQDYLSYINYEVKLLRLIKLRRDKFRIYEKKDEIEYAVTKRVTKLYKMALLYFKSDVKLWMSYINFCTQTRFVNAVSDAFKQMLQVHADKVHIWKYASRWELEEMKNIEGALNFLKQGLHHHPNSKELYTEAFKLELQSGLQKNKTDCEKCMLRAEVLFQTSVKTIDEIEYIIALLEITTGYDFTSNLQKIIVEYLIKNFWKSELMWHTMALRELHGLHYDEKNNKSRIMLCISVYKSALKVIPTQLMWEKYLDTLIDLYREKNKMSSKLLETLEEAYNAGFLLEKHFKVWIELEDNKIDILVKATKSLPESVDLWIQRLQFCLDQETELFTVSKEAISVLQKKSLPIYKLLIQYQCLKNCNFNEMKALFEEGIMRDPELSFQLRPMYIDWLCLTKNIKVARMEYDKISTYHPYCVDLHKKMIQLEMGRVGSISLHAIRNVHKLACQQFGKNRTDVWLDYIKFEMNASPRLISDVYNNAKNTLEDNLVGKFVSEYALLNSGATDS